MIRLRRTESAGMETRIQLALPTGGSPGDDKARGPGHSRRATPGALPVEDAVTAASKLVAVVDDDESVRESLPDLLRSFAFQVEAFRSAEAFLSSGVVARTDCLVLDVAMPGMSGLELQQEMARRNLAVPIVFITARTDEIVRATALRRGAVAYLTKPFSEEDIIAAVKAALGNV